MPSKFEFNKGKMVPYPSGAIVPDRDLGERPALECIHLGIEFGGLKAVDDFSLTIGKTEIAGLIGPNGAGKTTVFNLLTKVYQPTHGTILLDGEDTSGKSVYHNPSHPSFRTVMEKPPMCRVTLYMLIHKTMVKHMIIVKIRLSRLFCGIM